MGLEKKSDFQTNKLPKECKKVVICPETTEDRKAFRRDELQLIIQSLKSKYTNPEITLAVSNKKSRYFLEGHKHFFFKKNEQSSLKFLHLLKESDLIVSVDSGPLHLAKALSKSTVALFACTAPEIIIDDFSYITPIRTNKLNQIQCENKFCKEPLCLIELFSSNILGQVYTPKQKIITYSKECCPYKEECAETWQVEI
jgi:ADP-heptose:LPS heptosyltransferase